MPNVIVEPQEVSYFLGKNACREGLPLDKCPFPKYENDWHLWMAGYSAVEFNG